MDARPQVMHVHPSHLSPSVWTSDAGHKGLEAAGGVEDLATASVHPINLLSQYQPRNSIEDQISIQGSSPASIPLDIRFLPAQMRSDRNAPVWPFQDGLIPKQGFAHMDSLEQAFLASGETPPHEQGLLAPMAGNSPHKGVLSAASSLNTKKPAFSDQRKAVPAVRAPGARTGPGQGSVATTQRNVKAENWSDIQVRGFLEM